MPWLSPTWGPLSTRQMMAQINEWIRRQRATGTEIEIAAGTDGYVTDANTRIRFDSILLVHHPGRGGIYFWRGLESTRGMTLEETFFLETEISVIIGRYVLPSLPRGVLPAKRFSLHLDISSDRDSASHRMLSLCVSWCSGLGFATHAKPQAVAASKVADSYNRGGAKRLRLGSTRDLEDCLLRQFRQEDGALDREVAGRRA